MNSLILVFSSLALAGSVPGDRAAWESLTTSPVPVECVTAAGEPWCRSTGLVLAPIAQVSQALEDMRHNAHLFDSVLRIDILEGDAVHVVLDYPSPLDDRDYVARYTYTVEGDAHVFRWVSELHPGAPITDEAVRLPAFAGEWRLEPRGEHTWVRYTWQAEINGSFPSFGYSTARKRAGHEALKDLANTQGAALSAP